MSSVPHAHGLSTAQLFGGSTERVKAMNAYAIVMATGSGGRRKVQSVLPSVLARFARLRKLRNVPNEPLYGSYKYV